MPFALTPDVAAQFVVNLLAVGGAFLIGRWLVGLGVWLLFPKAPPGAKKAAQLLGGVGLAVLAAVILFGHGQGWTLFGGGGTGASKGNGPTEQTGDGTGPVPTTVPTSPTPATARIDGEAVRVTVLGGTDVRDERFYKLAADPARSFAELTTALDARRAIGKKFHVELLFTSDNTLPRDHPAVTRLTAWAQANGLTVSFPAP